MAARVEGGAAHVAVVDNSRRDLLSLLFICVWLVVSISMQDMTFDMLDTHPASVFPNILKTPDAYTACLFIKLL